MTISHYFKTTFSKTKIVKLMTRKSCIAPYPHIYQKCSTSLYEKNKTKKDCCQIQLQLTMKKLK